MGKGKIIAGAVALALIGGAIGTGIAYNKNENFRSKFDNVFHKDKNYETKIAELQSKLDKLTNVENQIKTLEAEKQNLLTEKLALQTKLTENENQIKTLQAEKLRLEEQVLNMATAEEVASLRSQIADLDKQIKELEEEDERLNARITSLEARVAVLETQVAELQETVTNLNTRLEDLTNQIDNLWNVFNNYTIYTDATEDDNGNVIEDPVIPDLAMTETAKKAVENRITNLNNQVEQKRADVQVIQSQRENVQKEISNLNTQKDDFVRRVTENNTTISEKNRTIEIKNTSIENKNRTVINNNKRIEVLESKENLTEDEQSELEELNSQNLIIRGELLELQEQVVAMREEVTQLENNNTEYNQRIDDLEQRIVTLEEEVKELETQTITINSSIDGLQNQIDKLRNFVSVSTIVPDSSTGTGEEQHKHINLKTRRENEASPTCTSNGHYDLITYCEECNEVLSTSQKIIPALGHEAGEIVIENRTQTTTGLIEYDKVTYCTRCGEEISREHITEEPEHQHINIEERRENEVVGADGTIIEYDKVTFCKDCGAEISREHITENSTHEHNLITRQENEITDEDGTITEYDLVTYCSVCGEEISREHIKNEVQVETEYEIFVSGVGYITFKENMTWGDWANSSYNNTNLRLVGEYLLDDNFNTLNIDYSKTVLATDVISKNNNYVCNFNGTTLKKLNINVFTLSGRKYQKSKTMTWAEWLNSEYNTSDYKLTDDGYIMDSTYSSYVCIQNLDNYKVSATDEISETTSYWLIGKNEFYFTIGEIASTEGIYHNIENNSTWENFLSGTSGYGYSVTSDGYIKDSYNHYLCSTQSIDSKVIATDKIIAQEYYLVSEETSV